MNPLTRRDLLRAGGAAGTLAALGTATACTGGSPRPAPSGTAPSSPTGASPGPGSLRFPDGFLWGTATSAYQVEGAAAEDGRGPSVWDTFARRGRIQDGSNGDVAADQYHLYREDIALMKDLGVGAYRFSVSWSRVLPTGAGAVNQKGLDYYRRLVDALLDAGIAPVATLWHWDTPQGQQDDGGGWENREVAVRFGDYAAVVGEAIGDRVARWLTLNEPKTVVDVGYTFGVHAPGFTDPAKAATVLHHLALGHGYAVQALRAARGQAPIGPCLNLMPTYPAEDGEEARRQAALRDVRENTIYLDPIFLGSYPEESFQVVHGDALRAAIRDGDLETIAQPVDYLGVNYYNPINVTASGDTVRLHEVASPAEWLEIYPQGLADMLTRLERDYGVELLITENGRPDGRDHSEDGEQPDDQERITFLRDHLAAVHRAIEAGAKVKGYLAWSLLDNFEWAAGYTQRFGLVHVDFDTLKRTPKASADWYRTVVAENAV